MVDSVKQSCSQFTPPRSETELLSRATTLAGMSLETLANTLKIELPQQFLGHKGRVGDLLELALGADAASRAEPDFTGLGIELKTIPVSPEGKPLESTFVTSIPLLDIHKQTWESSTVLLKLNRVLWIPIVTTPEMTVPERIIGMPLLWSPSEEQVSVLQHDWQELVDKICLGELENISARFGTSLQIRPKAADSKALCWAINSDGDRFQTLPRGFYLRVKFTQQVLADYFL